MTEIETRLLEPRASRAERTERASVPEATPLVHEADAERMFGDPRDGRAWYRREPWLLASVSALALTVVAVALPSVARNIVLALAGGAMLAAAVLLVRR